MKSSHGTFAAIVWIIAGTLLYYTEPEAKLFSWQTPVFFVIGMFAAGGILGSLSYAGVRGLTHALVTTRIVTAPTPRAQNRPDRGRHLILCGPGGPVFHIAQGGLPAPV